MEQLNANAAFVIRYLPFVRAHAHLLMQDQAGNKVPMPASQGFVLPKADEEGDLELLDTPPQLDDEICAFLEVKVMYLKVEDDGEVLVDGILGDPLENGEILGVTVAEDVVYDLNRIKANVHPMQFGDIQHMLTEMGVDKTMMVFVMGSGAEMMPLVGNVTVEKTPAAIQATIDAEGQANPAPSQEPAEDPNSVDSLQDDDDD